MSARLTHSEEAGMLNRNTLWMICGYGFRFAIQAAYFTLMARSLGTSNYGVFVGVVALVGILYPFAGLGRGNLLIQSVALDPSAFSGMWGTALGTTLLSGGMFIIIVSALSHFALPGTIPLALVVMVATSDILGQNILCVAGQAFQAFERLKWTAFLNVFFSVSRLVAALLLYAIDRSPTPLQWGYAYFASTAVVTGSAIWLVSRHLGAPALDIPHSWREVREGFYFSTSLSAQTVYNDIDKTMLVRLSGLTATGVYGAAYRIIDVSFAPIAALLYSAYPAFFRKGAAGIASGLAYARLLLLRAISYAIAVSIAIVLLSGFVPVILGAQYAETAEALRWLAALPVLKSIHYFLSNALTGAGYQGTRTLIQVGVAVFNVLLNMWLISRYSWRGAAWSSIASDALLTVAIAFAATILTHRSRPLQTEPSRLVA